VGNRGGRTTYGSVHLGEVVHGRQEDVDLDDLGDVGPAGLQHRGEVLDAELGHLRYAGARLREDLARGRAWDLARAVDGARRGYCLGLCGCVRCDNVLGELEKGGFYIW